MMPSTDRDDRRDQRLKADRPDPIQPAQPMERIEATEPEVEEETDEAIGELVRQRREALARAETRLAQGRYGRSVRSGAIIPDERLEADPLAELTAAEAAQEEA